VIDIELTQDTFGNFDVTLENGDLKGENGFDTAIWVSLFTDARAPESKVTIPENRRGWIGNLVSPVENRELGGLLWLAEQRRLTQDTLNEIIDYARKSLQWFVEDEIAVNIEVTGVIVPKQGIRLQIDIEAPSGNTKTHYVPLWELTGV
jgi:phage gp46-like protein